MNSSNSAKAINTSNVIQTNFRLLFIYAAPYLAFVALGSFSAILSIEQIYTLRLILVPALIVWAWRWYMPLRGPKNIFISAGWGGLVGIAGTVIWILLLAPFVETGARSWGNSAFYLRSAAAVLVVPVFEELFMRGYIYHFVLQWDLNRKKNIKSALDKTLQECNINEIQNVTWNLRAAIISTVAFTLGHQMFEWPASMAYGMLMAILLAVRKDLITCVIAHGTTNFCLAMYVYGTGSWQYW